MNIIIKKATIKDLDEILEWRMRVLREVFSLDEAEKNYSLILANNEAYYKKNLVDNNHTACFAIENNSRIVGCGGICYQLEMPSPDNLSGTNGYLMNIYSLPEFRGKGIGKMIVEFLIDDAKKRGVEKIYLESSKIARNLYREIGFEDLQDYMKLA